MARSHVADPTRDSLAERSQSTALAASPARQAYHALHLGFIVAPAVAGADKFTQLLTNWDAYLAPQIAALSPVGVHGFMLVVGVIEVAAALLVALKPSIGGYVVSAWLLGIIANLLLAGIAYDVALRDLGLAIGAFALARLATANERGTLV